MIAKFKHIPQNALFASIDYHEKKCENSTDQNIQKLVDHTFSSTNQVSETCQIFKDTVDLNSKVNQNKYMHIVLSFDTTERLPNEKLTEITDDYMSKMGFTNCPHLAYVHNDTAAQHIHILSTTVDFEGKKVNEYDNYKKSLSSVKDIEKKYKLVNHDHGKNKNVHDTVLNEINYRKYFLFNTVKKGLRDYSVKGKLNDMLNEEQKNIFKSKKAVPILELKGYFKDDEYKKLLNFLNASGLFKTLKKDKLMEKLNRVHKDSTSMNDFFDRCYQEGIYTRLLFNKKQELYVMYGFKDESFYVKESSLSGKFRYANLEKGFDPGKDESKKEGKKNEKNTNEDNNLNQKEKSGFDNQHVDIQKKYIREVLNRVVPDVTNLNSLMKECEEFGVSVITYKNSGGIYGISFKCIYDNDPFLFKGSMIGKEFSWNTLKTKFGSSPEENIPEKIVLPGYNDRVHKEYNQFAEVQKNNSVLNQIGKKLSPGGIRKQGDKESDEEYLRRQNGNNNEL